MISPQTGALLIADPFLKDPNFKRSVIFLCEHLTNGSFGLIVNKPLNITLGEVIEGLEGNKTKIYFGGPVQVDTLHFLHQLPNLIPDSIKVAEGVYWGGDFDKVVALIKENAIDLRKIRFYLGYSGWEENQLENEIDDASSWLTANADSSIIFHKDVTKMWPESLSLLGGDFPLLKNSPIDPQLN